MGCNCKRVKEFEDKYGTPTDENVLEKIGRFLAKCGLFVLIVAISIIITPFVMVYAVFKMFTDNNFNIKIPKNILKMIA